MPEHTVPEKPILAGLIAFGILGVVLGVQQIRAQLVGGRPRETTAPAIPRTLEELEQRQRTALAARDTDGDGLTDADELERTKTSPFLSDSDSDGKTDKQEVDAGEDPNCPAGRTCAAPDGAESPSKPPMPSPPVPPPALQGAFGQALRGPAGVDPRAFLASLPKEPAAIRDLLRKAGMSEDDLVRIDDATLLATWAQVMADVERQIETTTAPSAGPKP